MKNRAVLFLGILILAVGYSQKPISGQQPVPGVTRQYAPTPSDAVLLPQPIQSNTSPRPPAGIIPTPPVAIPQPPKERSLDLMLDELDQLRAQKTELMKKEELLIKAIQQKADKQTERMNGLGLAPPIKPGAAEPGLPSLPDRIGRILIEGNIGKDDNKKILKLLDFAPGQVLQYPKLEASRTRLEKAGYKLPTVEVKPGEGGPGVLDIVVKVSDSAR